MEHPLKPLKNEEGKILRPDLISTREVFILSRVSLNISVSQH